MFRTSYSRLSENRTKSSNKSSRALHRRLFLEGLEDRRLLAGIRINRFLSRVPHRRPNSFFVPRGRETLMSGNEFVALLAANNM